jgi:5-methylcytosine-specific restriction enzyme A
VPERSWVRPSAFAAQRLRGRAWMALREQVMSEEYRCYKCGQLGQASDLVDHVVPLAQGGTDDRVNLRRCCRACHATKTGRESARARG